ncbi:c-type cytochrome [Roseitranquillus sediminis]|uniref:c-type cytochrome n=1 Tax=Roseitranquillus sediminis TaxID=2809051 RepID=UPI001D0C4624|nr:c-type cytochrome [Roseitranquillus sediminis]MBM9595488.1 hypothetical protein [Roseitranquillus sediminis]
MSHFRRSALCLPIAGLLANAAPAQTPEALALACANCHGPGGASLGAIPAIDELSADEMAVLLLNYRSGELEGTIMNRIARGYTEDEIAAISSYLAAETAR